MAIALAFGQEPFRSVRHTQWRLRQLRASGLIVAPISKPRLRERERKSEQFSGLPMCRSVVSWACCTGKDTSPAWPKGPGKAFLKSKSEKSADIRHLSPLHELSMTLLDKNGLKNMVVAVRLATCHLSARLSRTRKP